MAARLRITGPVIPFGRSDADHDLIVPARHAAGNVFDDPWYRGAPILAAGADFGRGAPGAQAVRALLEAGIEAVIAPSFGGTFEADALEAGLAAIRLAEADVESLLELDPTHHVTIDLVGERVIAPDGEFAFQLDPFSEHVPAEGRGEKV